jgi:hypothetical protein
MGELPMLLGTSVFHGTQLNLNDIHHLSGEMQ